MSIGPILPNAENIARSRAEMAGWSVAQLLVEQAKEPSLAPGIAATQMLEEQRAAKAEAMYVQLLAEIKTPHWSVTPAFWLLVVAVVISLLALAVSVFGLPQVQKLVVESPALPQTSASGVQRQANSSAQSPRSPAAQTSRPKK